MDSASVEPKGVEALKEFPGAAPSMLAASVTGELRLLVYICAPA